MRLWRRIGISLVAIAATAVAVGARMGQSSSDARAWGSTIPGAGRDAAESSRDVVTKVLANSPDALRYAQATSDGIYREVTIKWTATPDRKATDGEIPLMLEGGRQAFIRKSVATPRSDGLGYTISFDFYLPAAGTPDVRGALASRSNSPLLAAAARMLESLFVTSALAAGSDGLSGSFTDVKTFVKGGADAPKQGFREALREREIFEGRARNEACFFFEVEKAQKWVKEWQQLISEMNSSGLKGVPPSQMGSNPEHAELNSRYQQLYGEALEADARAYWKSIPREARNKYSKARMDGVDAWLAKKQIELDKQALKDRIAALRRCHENPTEPTAIRAKRENDPARKQISEALDAVELQVEIDSGIREFAATLNSAASTVLGPLGMAMTGTAGAIEDQLLKQSMEDAVASLEKCVVRCCDQGTLDRSTQAADSSRAPQNSSSDASGGTGLNFTPGPDQLFTPGPARTPQPAPQPLAAAVCKGISRADVTFRTRWATAGRVTETTWIGGVDLRYVPDDGGWEGRGHITYRFYDDLRVPGVRFCPAGQTSMTTVTGRPSLVVRVQPTIDQGVTGGNDTGGMPANTSVVEVVAGAEPDDLLSEETQAQECGQDKSSSGQYSGPGTECHFYVADLTKPGFYTMEIADPLGANGRCTLSIY